MNPRPVEEEAIDNKTLVIKFSNGEVKEVDISAFLQHPMYKKLADYSFLKQVKADRMTV
jgi:hypothetical protein